MCGYGCVLIRAWAVDERLEIHRLYLEALRCEQQGDGNSGNGNVNSGNGNGNSGNGNSDIVPFVWAETTHMASTRICHPQVRPRKAITPSVYSIYTSTSTCPCLCGLC